MTGFFAELRRRHVFRIGIAYLVVAWLLTQVVGVISPIFDLPPWFPRAVIILLGIGFPVALILAWAFEMTPEGVKRTDELDEASPRRKSVSTGRKLDFVVITALVLAVGFLFWRLNYGPTATKTTASPATTSAPPAAKPASDILPNSVAVLPFENLSPKPDDAYFAAGLHEEVIDQISKIHSMSVIARPSVMQYAKETKPIPQIAHELHVETVMAGSVRFSNDRVRVSAQLVDGFTGTNLWSDTYERPLGDVFKIEADIAMNVANALQAQFSPEEQVRIEKAPTKSPEAYALFLQAQAEKDLPTHISLLQQAVSIDPDFALAYAGTALSQAFSLINTVAGVAVSAPDRAETERLSRMNAERAIEIDPNVPKAYAALALPAWLNWHWTEAAKDFSHALEVQPNDITSRTYYGFLLSAEGRADEAVAIAKRAVELDPGNPNAGFYGVYLGAAGQHAAAVDVFKRAATADPTDVLTRLYLAFAEIAVGDSAGAVDQLVLLEHLAGDNHLLESLAYIYGRAGRPADAQRFFEKLKTAANKGLRPGAGGWAFAYLGIGDEKSALDWLEKAAQKAANHEPDEGFFDLLELKHNPTNDPVLKKPEFVRVLSRIKGD